MNISLVVILLPSILWVSSAASYCQQSTFDNGDGEGWVTTNGESSPGQFTNSFTGQNLLTQGDWYFVAPPKFRGTFQQNNQTQFNFVNFKLKAVATPLDFVPPSNDDLIIQGTKLELIARLPSAPLNSVNNTNYYSLKFFQMNVRPSGSTGNGSPATPQDVLSVLSFVQCVKLRGKYSNTPHFTVLDSFQFCDGDGTQPALSCPRDNGQECSGNGACYSGVCRCKSGFFGPSCSNRQRCEGAARLGFAVPPSSLPKTFSGPFSSFSGIVQDNWDMGSQPVDNATVELRGEGSFHPLATSLSDASGKFQFSLRLPSQFSYYLSISKTFYEPKHVPLPPLGSSSLSSPLKVILNLNLK
eukprot:TRINITY_DN1417_c0_g1_i1.p1 TRINITY_DN1417_c0_g1~~TRINITY_DN1417_c0_g1_i1.p1  ORF type:complete len:380 (+),score=69.26 TRINITY_DN1417_c0_g1_i1:74-1141(+)